MPEDITKEEKEKILLYQLLQTRMEELKNQLSILEQSFIEIETTISGLDILDGNEKGVLVPFGSGCYTQGILKGEKKVLVDIGAKIFVEKDVSDAKKLLEERKENITKALTNLQSEANEIINKMNSIVENLKQK